MVTAGPGLTNAITAIANSSVSRSSVLVLSGRTPSPQVGMGAMQDVPQAEVVAPLCRRTECVSAVHHVLPRLDAVIAAALGAAGEATGPAYIDFSTDLLDQPVHPADIGAGQLLPRRVPLIPPHPDILNEAVELIRRCRRILVVGGRSVCSAVPELQSFLRLTNALYLDTGECRGAVPGDDPAYVPAMRGRVMQEADLVITLGRRLDFQLGYGSPAVFAPSASFLRVGRYFEETAENRRGDVEIVADVALTLQALVDLGATSISADQEWVHDIKSTNEGRTAGLKARMSDPPLGSDGRMHPYRLIHAINAHLGDDSVVVADGGDILSFARVGLKPVRYLDCGALGCLGVGVPFGIAAALNTVSGSVVALIGDGSFGFTAIEVDTAVRRNAKVLFIVANNESWNIERHDQVDRYASNLVGVDLPGCRYNVLARGLGAYAERVDNAADLDAAIARGLERAPALLDVLITKDAISPDYQSGLAVVPPRQVLNAWNDAELERYHE